MLRIDHAVCFGLMMAVATMAAAGSVDGQRAMDPRERHAVTDFDAVASHDYTKHQVEYYLTDDEKSYARPGLTVEIVDVDIPADRYPVVEVTFVDDMGQPLDRNGVLTPGSISMRFVIAWYDAVDRQYTAYTTRVQTSPITGDSAEQATSDSGGTWEDVEIGRAFYTFGTQLPEDFDMTKTHTVYVYGTRNTEDLLGKDYESDPTFDFRPDGAAVTETWAAILTETCNNCHDPLALHGGHRRDLKGCATCHNPQSTDPDTGNTVDLKVMVHKIHFGASLPSVQAGIPYQIIGFRQSVHDYSDVVHPQDVRNCWNCHAPEAEQGFHWYTYPTRAACASCHDDIDWETGENHAGGPADNDNGCVGCHPPQGTREFDTSVIGAHTIPTKSNQLPGLNMEIVDVMDAAPGATPTVMFTLTNDDGSVVEDVSALRTLNLRAAGPIGDTIDFSIDISEDARDATLSDGVFTATFSEPIPGDATGTWGFSADVRRTTLIDDGSADGLEVTEGAFNPIFYAAVTDDEPMPRREVVSMDKCNVCHDVLALHGGQRFNVTECVFCHRPNADDSDVRPDEELPPESVDMRWLIHRLHTGANLVNDFTVYGFRGSVHNYNKVVYPGDLRNCAGCHDPGTYSVPLPEGTQPVKTERDYYSPMMPAAASCLACHSSVDAAAHAYVNTAPFGESCASCHGDDRAFSVDKVHAR
jgi:OmcA/MtrC family decaheme c-type cytochrome